jgi:hypothetical protein
MVVTCHLLVSHPGYDVCSLTLSSYLFLSVYLSFFLHLLKLFLCLIYFSSMPFLSLFSCHLYSNLHSYINTCFVFTPANAISVKEFININVFIHIHIIKDNEKKEKKKFFLIACTILYFLEHNNKFCMKIELERERERERERESKYHPHGQKL